MKTNNNFWRKRFIEVFTAEGGVGSGRHGIKNLSKEDQKDLDSKWQKVLDTSSKNVEAIKTHGIKSKEYKAALAEHHSASKEYGNAKIAAQNKSFNASKSSNRMSYH